MFATLLMPRLRFCAILLAISVPSGALAAGWENASLQWSYYAYGGLFDGPHGCTVGHGNICGTFQDYFNIVTDDHSITFDYSIFSAGQSTWSKSKLSLPPTIHNGIAIDLLSAGRIVSVKIDPATNMQDFGGKHVSFTDKEIQVDWRNRSFDSSTIVKLDVRLKPD
jgi:hypothetical protein